MATFPYHTCLLQKLFFFSSKTVQMLWLFSCPGKKIFHELELAGNYFALRSIILPTSIHQRDFAKGNRSFPAIAGGPVPEKFEKCHQ
jgi:hypothetical protein